MSYCDFILSLSTVKLFYILPTENCRYSLNKNQFMTIWKSLKLWKTEYQIFNFYQFCSWLGRVPPIYLTSNREIRQFSLKITCIFILQEKIRISILWKPNDRITIKTLPSLRPESSAAMHYDCEAEALTWEGSPDHHDALSARNLCEETGLTVPRPR